MNEPITLTEEQVALIEHGTVTTALVRQVLNVAAAKLQKDILGIKPQMIAAPNNSKRLMQEKAAMNIGLMTIMSLSQAFESVVFEAVKGMGEKADESTR